MSTYLVPQLFLFTFDLFSKVNTLIILLVLMALVILWLLIALNRNLRKNTRPEGRKVEEEALQKILKEKLDYKYALDESSIVAITDQNGIIMHVNENFCKISKYSRAELIGQDHRIINSGYHSKEFIREIWMNITKGKIWRGELKNRAKDGTIYWVDTTIVPFLDEQGKPYQYVAIRADITQRKLAEEEILDYKYALDESSIVVITDQNGIIMHVNENFCKISKYSRAELIGLDQRLMKSGYHPEAYIQQIWATIINGKIWRGEIKNEAKDGTFYWVDTTIVPFLNDQGKPYQYLSIRADITQRKLVEEEIKTLNEELENRVNERTAALATANLELQSFNYVSSHDLQEPLRKIQTFAKLILEKEKDALSGTGKDYFNRIQDAAARMQQLIVDLLAFSSVTNNDRIFEKTHLRQIVEDIIKDMSESILEKNARIEVTELCEVNIIKFQFRQLMQNLISNALKFSTPQRAPVITIKSNISTGAQLNITLLKGQKQLPADKPYCHITVTDNGIGFDQTYRDRIFELFQRLHEKEAFPGTGIGLAIVKKIVDNHAGLIIANGEIGQGARFDIFIPA